MSVSNIEITIHYLNTTIYDKEIFDVGGDSIIKPDYGG